MLKNYLFVVLAILFTMNIMAQNIPSYVPKDGLVGYWPFNGNANDESGNGNHGTVNGATLTDDRNGVANSSYDFDGLTSFIFIPDNNFPDFESNFTFSTWFKSEKFNKGGINMLLSKHHCTSNDGTYALGIWDDNNTSKFKINFSGSPYFSSITYPSDSGIVSLNIWNNFVVRYNKSTKLLAYYLNGNKVFSKFLDFMVLNNNDDFYIGVQNCGTKEWFFNGQIDDIAIYNRALSDQEIKQLYEGCTKETAKSSSFNSIVYTTNTAVNLNATPTGGSFSGNGVANNAFNPSKAKLGKNQVKYNFKNTTGCADSTDFTMLVVDTVGATCTKFDTITVKNNVYDTVTIKNNVFDTVKVTKYDTLTVTNNVTKYDTITITNNVTKYDTVIINKTKYDTVIVKTNVFDTVKVTKYDTLTVTNNVTKYDTVSILKIKFKLTTGIHANQLSSLSIYPNPTSDVLHIDVPDAKALEGYRYRILDALGKEVYNQLVTQSTTEIPLKTLGAAGIYQFEILDATKTSIQSNKIVLQ